MEKSKRTIIQAVICVGLVCLIWGGYFYVMRFKVGRILEITKDDFSWIYQVDSIENDDGDILLKGFAFQLGTDADGDNYEIVLQEIQTGENIFLKMSYFERKDVNDYFLCEYDYLQSGFEARIKEKKLDLQEKDYEVLLRMAGEKNAYRTGTYLAEGQLVYANPQEFVPLEVEGTDLEDVVNEGILRVYLPHEGMYVYQYGGELYWIAEAHFFTGAEKSHMEYQLLTTQVDKLPEDRIMNTWDCDNRVFNFDRSELLEQNNGKYRVVKKYIPTEYSITEIWTGNYVDKWIWLSKFRPYYSLKSS